MVKVLAAPLALVLAGCRVGAIASDAPPASHAPASQAPASQAPVSHVLTIGVDLPLPEQQLVVDAIQLAIDDFNAAGGAHGSIVQASIRNDVAPASGNADPQVGAANVQEFVADSTTIGMVGPFNSTVARAVIPITNVAGLLECSPSNTAPDLTKPPGGLAFRQSFPDRISYVRVATTDDVQGPAAAVYARQILHRARAFVVNDSQWFGQGVAAGFATEFTKDGGIVVGTATLTGSTADTNAVVSSAKAARADVVYFGGTSFTGAGDLRVQMAARGLGAIAFIGPDGMADHHFIDQAGQAASNSYSTLAVISDYPGKADFVRRYVARFGSDPGPYGAPAYACAEVILDALRHSTASDGRALREAIRAYAVDSRHQLPTILGDISFDANGDTNRRTVSVYRVDLAAAAGAGDWVFDREVDLPIH
ncbi:MAG TPA: branched-chain amino acid ABC transporter substrate-binding protein [Candidatus Limnocylindrales bacterium]|nr:branched-chain amino acid ABC transporter substrate-binding protein [Candidatus Limnocylindrales bacterium]